MKFSLLLLLTIVSAVLCTSQGPDTRIVGGYPATIYNYPFVVSIVYTNPETGEQTPRCVGSIISSWHVLTTAHCFSDPNVENYKLRVGSTSSMEGGTLFDIYYIIIHPDYVESPRTADAAIVVLTQHVTISESVRVIYIPPQETYIPDGYTVRAIGWGAEEEDGALLDTLKVFDTRTIPLQQCIEAFADDDNINVYDQVICTQAAGRSMCTGDSGAPIIIGEVLVGIASYSNSCDDSTPDTFTRIDRHTGWILQEAVPPYGRSAASPVRVAPVV
uniref:Trypsin-like serine protease 13 n=1 Tax=Ostrinia nubilalis TaxID=29057 RepID=I6TRU2_OSTNU|nr:trypsin-like serine protease 13 [Ostrinia nubilalis]